MHSSDDMDALKELLPLLSSAMRKSESEREGIKILFANNVESFSFAFKYTFSRIFCPPT